MRRRPRRRSRHLAVRGRRCPKVSSSVAFGKRQRPQTSPTFGEEEAAPLPHQEEREEKPGVCRFVTHVIRHPRVISSPHAGRRNVSPLGEKE
ncbi:hypothetical protein BHE74_00024086 [Ensete ventricosum]|nr:hypothetical protein BHE74_00024086 [Ensete ventricosum]